MTIQWGLALLSGGLVGVLLGATGGGGALMAIPLLVYVVGVPLQSATATSLVVVGVSALVGAWRENFVGHVRGFAAVLFSLTGAMGAWLGAQGHGIIREELVLTLFGGLMVAIGVLTIQRSLGKVENSSIQGCAVELSRACALKALGIGFGVGLLTGFFGVGGGFVIVPALVLIMGFPMRIAVGTSLLIIALTSLGGIAGHVAAAGINVRLTILVTVGSLLGLVVGRYFAKCVAEQTLTKAFGILAGVLGLFIIFDNGWRP